MREEEEEEEEQEDLSPDGRNWACWGSNKTGIIVSVG